MQQLLIIGGSDAGISAALRAGELDPGLGITLLVADSFPNYSICGIPYFLSGEVGRLEELAHRPLRDLSGQGINLLLEHRAERIDPREKQVAARGHDGALRAFRYDTLIIATGAVSVRPDLPGIDLPGVFPLRWIGDTVRLHRYLQQRTPRTAVIVGGGYIGMEMAEALTHRGLAVTVVEALPQVMATLDPDLGERVASTLRANRVSLRTEVRVESIASEGEQLRVAGSQGFSSLTDLVLVVIGARPETRLAAEAGIATGLKGALKVNQRMETDHASIFAAGDCVETWNRLTARPDYLPLGTTAHKQGRIAGENAVGGRREFLGSVGTQAVRVFDRVIARTGLHDADARAAGLEPLSVDSEHWDHKIYYPLARRMLIRLTGEPATGRLLGAQIIGSYGSEVSKRIDIFAAALHHGMPVAGLEDLDLSYTPPLSSPWDPVQVAAQTWLGASLQGRGKG